MLLRRHQVKSPSAKFWEFLNPSVANNILIILHLVNMYRLVVLRIERRTANSLVYRDTKSETADQEETTEGSTVSADEKESENAAMPRQQVVVKQTENAAMPRQQVVVKQTEKITKKIQQLLISAQEGKAER